MHRNVPTYMTIEIKAIGRFAKMLNCLFKTLYVSHFSTNKSIFQNNVIFLSSLSSLHPVNVASKKLMGESLISSVRL